MKSTQKTHAKNRHPKETHISKIHTHFVFVLQCYICVAMLYLCCQCEFVLLSCIHVNGFTKGLPYGFPNTFVNGFPNRLQNRFLQKVSGKNIIKNKKKSFDTGFEELKKQGQLVEPNGPIAAAPGRQFFTKVTKKGPKKVPVKNITNNLNILNNNLTYYPLAPYIRPIDMPSQVKLTSMDMVFDCSNTIQQPWLSLNRLLPRHHLLPLPPSHPLNPNFRPLCNIILPQPHFNQKRLPTKGNVGNMRSLSPTK